MKHLRLGHGSCFVCCRKIDSLEEVKDWIDIVHHHVPNKENTAIYLEMFYMYERLYNRLKEEFDCIVAFQRKNRDWEKW